MSTVAMCMNSLTLPNRLGDTIVPLGGMCFCHELYTNAGSDWLTYRHQIVLNLGLLILHDLFPPCIYPKT